MLQGVIGMRMNAAVQIAIGMNAAGIDGGWG